MGRPNTPQNPQPVNFGEDGSPILGVGDGDITSIRWTVEDRVPSEVAVDPTLRQVLNSLERETTSG